MYALIVTRFGGPEVLQWQEVPTPVPGAGEVRLTVTAAGVNHADVNQREGHYPPPPGASDILGLECSGVVNAAADDVTWPRVGDTVVALLAGGGYAEQVVVPAGQCLPLPDGIDVVDGATLMEATATAVSNLDLVHLTPGETVLMHGGAGGIGSFVIQYGKALGCRVIVTAGRADKLEYCRSLGADAAIDYHGDWWEGVAAATDGKGVDVIIDVIGGPYLEHNVELLARGGRLCVIGRQQGSRGTLDLGALQARQATVTATGLRGRPLAEKAAICAGIHERVWPMIASGAVKPSHITRFDIRHAVDAYALLDGGDNMGKIVLAI